MDLPKKGQSQSIAFLMHGKKRWEKELETKHHNCNNQHTNKSRCNSRILAVEKLLVKIFHHFIAVYMNNTQINI